MQAGPSGERRARTGHRHELRTLTYVTLDQANGGVVRNLSHDGIAVQVVAAVCPHQQLRLRFELRYPRLCVEARGEVVWATFSGQCGIRFVDLSPSMARQIDEWIFGDLLEAFSVAWQQTGSLLVGAGAPAGSPPSATGGQVSGTTGRVRQDPEQEDGLILSPGEVKVIELPAPIELARAAAPQDALSVTAEPAPVEPDRLSQPVSSRALIWMVNTLVVIAALLLFALVFLSVTRETPKRPLLTATVAALVIALLYWGFFKTFAGTSVGTRLARLVGADLEADGEDARFR